MGHNSVVPGHSKSIRISLVDKLSTGPPDLGCHCLVSELRLTLPRSSSGGIHQYFRILACHS